jgi:hypothetical protein
MISGLIGLILLCTIPRAIARSLRVSFLCAVQYKDSERSERQYRPSAQRSAAFASILFHFFPFIAPRFFSHLGTSVYVWVRRCFSCG